MKVMKPNLGDDDLRCWCLRHEAISLSLAPQNNIFRNKDVPRSLLHFTIANLFRNILARNKHI